MGLAFVGRRADSLGRNTGIDEGAGPGGPEEFCVDCCFDLLVAAMSRLAKNDRHTGADSMFGLTHPDGGSLRKART